MISSRARQLEKELLEVFNSQSNSIQQEAKLADDVNDKLKGIVAGLEEAKGIANPTRSDYLDGVWKLIYTSSPGTNSPIQRTVTANDRVSVYQVVTLKDTKQSFLPNRPVVSNVVCVGENVRLRISALGSTVDNPLVEPRKGDGKVFGINLFGVSSSKAPRDPTERIDFAFQEALFEAKDSLLTIPYPVPFKLLGDEAKGWIDNTYLSPNIRIARGNKGTLFVLQRADESLDKKAALASSTNLKGLSEESSYSPTPSELYRKLNISPPKKALASRAQGKVSATIIFPAQLGTKEDYEDLVACLMNDHNIKAYVVPLSRLDWPLGLLPSFFSRDYFDGTLKPSKALSFYLKAVDAAVQEAIDDAAADGIEIQDLRINLLAHSIGGWIARAWLSEWCSPELKKQVNNVVTLGSPHNPPPAGTKLAKIDQTRGLLTYINDNFPGSYEKNVRYTSVIGSSIVGQTSITVDKAIFRNLAFLSYFALSGDGKSVGDGIIPIATANLEGSNVLILDKDVVHSNYLPTPFRSIQVSNVLWYGSKGVLDKWVSYLT